MHPMGAEQRRSLDDPDAEPRQIELIVRHRARVLRRLAAQQRARGPAASLGDALDQFGDVLGHDASHREVVEEEQRLRPDAHDVVDAHRDEIDAHGGPAAGHARDLEFRADTVGRGREQPVVPDVEEPGEAAHRVGDLRPAGRCREVGDQSTAFAAASVSTPAAR